MSEVNGKLVFSDNPTTDTEDMDRMSHYKFMHVGTPTVPADPTYCKRIDENTIMTVLKSFTESKDYEDPKEFEAHVSRMKAAGCYFTMDDAAAFVKVNGKANAREELVNYKCSMLNAVTIAANSMSNPDDYYYAGRRDEIAKDIIKEYYGMSDKVVPYQPADHSKRPVDEETLMTVVTSAMKGKSYEEFHADMKAKGTDYSSEDLTEFMTRNLNVRIQGGYEVTRVAMVNAMIVADNKDYYDAEVKDSRTKEGLERVATLYRETYDPDNKHFDKQTGEYDYDGLISEVAANKTKSDYAELKKLRRAYEPEPSFDDVDFDDANDDFDKDLTDD